MAENTGLTSPNRISALVLVGVVACAPLPFGSTSNLAIAFWCAVLGIGLLFASPGGMNRRQLLLLAGIGLIIAAYAFVLHEQLSDSPWFAAPDQIWEHASAVLGRPIKPSVSILRDEPFYALGASLACILALASGLVVGSNETYARNILHVIAWSGGAYAIYGIFALLAAPTTLLLSEKTSYVGSLTGTFVNRNTAAAYFGSVAVIWLLLLLQKIRDHLPRGQIAWKSVPTQVLDNTPKQILVRFPLVFLSLSALFLTNSRAGVVVSLLGLAFAFVVFLRRDLPRGKSLVLVLAGTLAVVLVLLQTLGGAVEGRFNAAGVADQGRLAIYNSTLRMISDHPWFGTGWGTFPSAFPAYRAGTSSILGIIDIAHSTPLEIAAEMGIPLAALVGVGWMAAFGVLIFGVLKGRSRAIVPLGALAVSLIALLHSLIDFSLQIPGFAIVVFALLGVGLAQSLQDPESTPRRLRKVKIGD